MLAFGRDPIAFLQRNYETFGSIFSMRLGRRPAAMIVGPDKNRFFFTETGNILSRQELYKALGNVPFAAEPQEYKKQRAMLQPIFDGKRMSDYVEVMSHETSAWLDMLGSEGEFDLCASFERLSMHIVAASLIGEDFRQQMGNEFWALYRNVTRGMIKSMLPIKLPIPRIRRDVTKARLQAMIRPMLAERRAKPEAYKDIMQSFVASTYSKDTLVPEDTILSVIRIMAFAAYSTAAQASWVLVQLLQHPHHLALVQDEQETVLNNEAENISLKRLHQLERLQRALKETERMHPVTIMLARYTAKSYDLDGYHVPRGWLTMISPPISHRLSEIFPSPDKYDPERYLPARAEDRKVPFSLIGFGGGVYKCPGVPFVYNEIKVIVSLLLQRYTLELVGPDPQPDFSTGVNQPKSPCLVRYQQRL